MAISTKQAKNRTRTIPITLVDDQGEQTMKVTYRLGVLGKKLVNPKTNTKEDLDQFDIEDWIETVVTAWELVRGDEDNPIPIPPTREGIEAAEAEDEAVPPVLLIAVVGEIYKDARVGNVIKKVSEDI